MEKPNLLFITRTIYTKLNVNLISNNYNSFHVVVNLEEKKYVESLGGIVVACFEELFNELPIADVPNSFLQASYYGDRFIGWLSLKERRDIIGKRISFWRKVLSERHYTACFHETIAVEFEEVFSLLCAEYDTKDLSFITSSYTDYFYFEFNKYHPGISKEKIYSTPIKDELKVLMSNYMDEVKQKGVKPYWMIENSRRKFSLFKILMSCIKYEIKGFLGLNQKYSREEKKWDSLFYQDRRGTNWDFYDYKENIFYLSKNDYNDLEEFEGFEKYLFPIHYEPEAILSYYDPRFGNQVHIIESIAKQLPLNSVLLVKEHPSQMGALMLKKYAEIRKTYSNVAFIRAEVDSVSLLKLCKAMITICGSLGLESIIHNKPTIVLSNIYYDSHPDVYKLKTVEELKDVLLSELKIPNDENTLEYLSRFMSLNYKGNPWDSSLYDNKENLNNIVNSIEFEIKNKNI